MQKILVLLAFVTMSHAMSLSDIMHEEFETFKLEHKKVYDDEATERFRFNIYMENRHKIAKHNQLHAAGEVSFELGLNEFSDMLPSEFMIMVNGVNNTLREQYRSQSIENVGATFIPPAHVTVPTSVDWRQKGAVTEVKNQGHCGSCWAFSSTGALEGQHYRKSGVLISLSEQNLVDCSGKYGNYGCNGGFPDVAFRYIKENGGIDTETSYPYEGIDDSCRYNPKNVGATDKGFVDIPKGDEEKLKQALATIGPISVLIDAKHDSFYNYRGGLYFEPNCNPNNLVHAVLAVGYGTDTDGTDYWLVKNSWGTTWGDKGYIKMARNKHNHCGIATAASYPLV